MNTKMSQHLQRVHKDLPEVAKILSMKVGDPRRRQAFIKLQDEGDFNYNFDVLSSNKGKLIPKYSKKRGLEPESDYRACPHCKALYQRNLLSRHVRRCQDKPEGKQMKKGECSLMGRLLLPLPEGVSAAFFQKVIGKMKEDDISRIVRADSLILRYGERLFSRRDIEEHSSAQISCRLREMGRLCLLLRKKEGMRISTITQAIDPVHFDALVAAVRELGEFSTSTNMCKKGSLVLKLGYSLKKCSHILKAEGIKRDDKVTADKCERFQSLFEGDWFDHVSSCASQSVQRARMNKPKLLPSVADVEKVHTLLKKDLQAAESYPVLAKAVLASVTIFNRKRGGEVQRMKHQDYQTCKKSEMSQPEQEILQNLTTTEKKLVSVLHRVEIRGKFNRPVPVLLTPTMVNSIDKLLALRSLLGIDSDYLFASQTGEKPYRGSAVIKEYADAAKVSDPALFTATTLRKQLATLSQALEISKFNQDHLASFLGHDIRVHRNIYRQPLEVMQKAKVASILLKVNQGVQIGKESQDDLAEEEIDTGEPNAESQSADDSDDPLLEVQEKNTQVREDQMAEVSTSVQTATALSPNPQESRSKRTVLRKKWSPEEEAAVRRQLKQCLCLNRVPQKHEAERALAAEPVLRKRNWKDIKYFVYNLVKKNRQM